MWQGHDQVLTRPVTVKVLHAALAQDSTFRSRFREESIAAARLAHPNVVATYDTGEEAGTAFVVTELVRGQSLADALVATGAKGAAQAIDIADQAAAGLEHGHRAGLVHGAVSASSIFLCDDGLGGTRVKLADFGIAPTDGTVGPGDDVRALGAVLYEMLTGQPPAVRGTGEVPRPRKLRAGIPRPLDALTMRSISDDARHRFRSAFDFRRTLAALDLGPDDAEPFITRTPTPPAGMPSPRLRSRTTWVPLVVFLVLAGVAAAIVTWMLGRDGDATSPPSVSAANAVAVAEVHSFDPEASPPTENESRARFVVDGDRSTTWATERYRGARFAGLKKGLGLVIRLDKDERLSRLELDSPSRNWSARVYVADAPKTKLADWGKPVADVTSTNGDHIFNLQSTKGAAVLLWITDPGQSNQLEIREIRITS